MKKGALNFHSLEHATHELFCCYYDETASLKHSRSGTADKLETILVSKAHNLHERYQKSQQNLQLSHHLFRES